MAVHRILAIFAGSFLAVAPRIAPVSAETSGTVLAVCEESGRLQLDDGRSYALPSDVDRSALSPGMEVHLIYDAVPA